MARLAVHHGVALPRTAERVGAGIDLAEICLHLRETHGHHALRSAVTEDCPEQQWGDFDGRRSSEVPVEHRRAGQKSFAPLVTNRIAAITSNTAAAP